MKTFLFDLDGTIIDSRYDIAFSVNKTLERLNMPLLPVEEIVSFVGNGVRTLMTRVLAERPGDLDGAVKIFQEVYSGHLVERTVLYEGVDGVIQVLSESGALLLLVTNKPAFLSETILDHFGLRHYFKAIFGGDNLSLLKPSAALFEAMQSHYSLVPEDSYMIGDSSVDEAFARNSGIPFIFARFGNIISGSEKESIQCQFDASSVEELKRIVCRLMTD
jgi:phosphoglycolate phosphatase